MKNPALQERLVRELIAEDASLRGREEELRGIVGLLLEHDPVQTPSPAFVLHLREELRGRAEMLGTSRLKRWMLRIPIALTSTAALTAVVLLALPIARNSIKKLQSPAPEDEIQLMDTADDGADASTSTTAPYAEPAPTNMATSPLEPPAPAGGGTAENDAARDMASPEGSPPEGSTMMMQAEPRMTKSGVPLPTVELPEGLALPSDLPDTALRYNPETNQREEFPVFDYVNLDRAKGAIVERIFQRVEDRSAINTITLGLPKTGEQDVVFDGLPGSIYVHVWLFSDVTINGKSMIEYRDNPLVLPLQEPASM